VINLELQLNSFPSFFESSHLHVPSVWKFGDLRPAVGLTFCPERKGIASPWHCLHLDISFHKSTFFVAQLNLLVEYFLTHVS